MSHTEDASLVSVSVPSIDLPDPASIPERPNPNDPTTPNPPTLPTVPNPPTFPAPPLPGPSSTTAAPSPPSNSSEWLTLLQTMVANQTQLQNQQALLQELITNQQHKSQPATTLNNLLKFSDPAKFSGRPKDVNSFVQTIQAQIESAPDDSLTDFQMISYFASWLSPGVPEKWYNGIRESQPHLMEDYQAFVKAFIGHFGDLDSIESAHRRLATLKQTGSASVYIARFREIAVHCQQSD